MEERFKVIHINTSTKDRYPTIDGTIDGEPIIEKGEIAVNGAEGGEYLSIVNSENKIKIFKDWDSTKTEIDKKSYVWDISVSSIAGGETFQVSHLKTVISKHLQGIPLYLFNGQDVLPLNIQTDGENWEIYEVSLDKKDYLHRFIIPYDILNYNDDDEIEIIVGGDSPYELINKHVLNTKLHDYIKKSETYTKSEIDEKILTVKEFTLDGTSGELPLSEWDSLVNADLYICNGTYIYSHVLDGNVINFDIVTNMASTSTLLTSTTITFYAIENDGEKLIWSNRTYTGNLVENVVEELGDGEHIVISQKGITQQINAIKNDYQKKIISVATSETSKTINPNTYYKWGTMTSLNISLNTNVDTSILNEYIFEFTSGTTPTTLTLPSSIKWLNGIAPLIEQNKTYQVSIINNLGIITMFN